jgi:chromosome segregation ATPase
VAHQQRARQRAEASLAAAAAAAAVAAARQQPPHADTSLAGELEDIKREVTQRAVQAERLNGQLLEVTGSRDALQNRLQRTEAAEAALRGQLQGAREEAVALQLAAAERLEQVGGACVRSALLVGGGLPCSIATDVRCWRAGSGVAC